MEFEIYGCPYSGAIDEKKTPVAIAYSAAMSLFLYSICLAVFFSAIVGRAYAAEPVVYDLGLNLLNESCEAREQDDLAQIAGLPNGRQIFCAGNLSGQVAYERYLSGGTQSVDAIKAAVLSQYARSRTEKSIEVRATCKAVKWIEGVAGHTVALLPCHKKSGGWPYLVLVSVTKTALVVVDGTPALLPVMLKLAELNELQINTLSSKEYLQKLWDKPLVMASSKDLDRFRQLILEARSASNNFNYVQAEDVFRKVLALQVTLLSENDPAIADTLMDLALNVSNQGKTDEAQGLFQRAASVVQKSPFEADRARLASYLAFEAANREDYEAALTNSIAATDAWRKLAVGDNASSVLRGEVTSKNNTERAELAMALAFQAKMALRNEDIVSASARANEALLVLNQVEVPPKWWKADVLTILGEVSVAQGRLSAAETYFNSALAIRKQEFGDGVSTLPVLTALGRAYQSEGMNSSAIITYRTAFQIARTLPQSSELITHEQLVPFAAAIVDYAATLSNNTARQGLYAEAFDAFQLARTSIIDKTIAKAQARLRNDDPNILALVEQLHSTQRQIDVDRAELSIEQSLPDQDRSRIVEARLLNKITVNQRSVSAINAQVATQFPGYHQLTNPKSIDLIEMRKRLGEREALVSFIIGKKRSFIQVIKRQGSYVETISEGEAALLESVNALRRALEIQGGAVNEFNMLRSHELYKILFGRVESHIQGIDHLIIASTGALASLPFGLLITAAPKDGNYSTALWLGQSVAISHSPSLQAFYTLRGAVPQRIPPKVMLAFGDPVLAGAKPGLSGIAAVLSKAGDGCRPAGPMDGSVLRALSSLPETSAELKTIAGILGAEASTLFLREQATEENFRAQNLEDYRVLYFATHGLLPGELKCQNEPGLVLTPAAGQADSKNTDGLLEASEIAALKLNADMVVLSACNTAGSGGKFGGEALSGLAESFFFAGARSLLVSHWQVPSGATAQLMSAAFLTLGPELKGGASKALMAAQATLIAKKETAHPFFWAAFVVIGDGMAASSAQFLKSRTAVAAPVRPN